MAGLVIGSNPLVEPAPFDILRLRPPRGESILTVSMAVGLPGAHPLSEDAHNFSAKRFHPATGF
jgi:hypothetical protein